MYEFHPFDGMGYAHAWILKRDNYFRGTKNMVLESPLHFAELLTSRLCHDLITPIGAINTGLELFQETTPAQENESEEILNLVLNSAQTASARVSFYRIAFGSGGNKITLSTAKTLIENYFVRSKLQIHWDNSLSNDMLLDKMGRILLNAILWISECAPRGGQLLISLPRGDLSRLSLRLKTDSIIIHQGTLEALEGNPDVEEITPRTVPCYLVHALVKGEKGTLVVNHTTNPSELVLEVSGQ